MPIKIASLRGNDKLAKTDFWSCGFKALGDEFVRYGTTDIIDNIDCFLQFNVINRYRLAGEFRNVLFQYILDSKKPFIVWEEGSFRQFSNYKKIGWYHYNNTGIFNNDNVDNKRWKKILKNTRLVIKDWRASGQNILIMGQVEKDSALVSLYEKGYNTFIEWVEDLIIEIRKYTDRPIVIRPHPRDLKNYEANCKTIIKNNINVSVSTNFSIEDRSSVKGGDGLFQDLRKAYCAVTYNSNSIVEAITEGVPVFAMDQGSVAYDIAHKDLSMIESLDYNIDISPWCSRVAYTMWDRDEIRKGETWAHLKPVFFK